MTYRGKTITAEDTAFIRELIAENPEDSRCRLSEKLCTAWDWRQANGHLKAMVCRCMMLELERRGLIKLPPRRQTPHNPLANRRKPSKPDIDETPIKTTVKQRFLGTCYKAANWTYLGKTTGRGKNDHTNRQNRSLKAVWGYPLHRKFKKLLCEGQG